MTELNIHHDAAAARFEARVGDHVAEVVYRLNDGLMNIVHTEVPPPYEGRGIAAKLVHAALEHARASGWKVRASCSYVRAYMRRHPHTHDLLEAR
jgi:predicted GNAT family acetyltransferase